MNEVAVFEIHEGFPDIEVKGIFMSDYEMNQNSGAASEYQPVIDRLREIAVRGMRMESRSDDPAILRRYEMAGSQGGQMMGKEALDSMQQLMSNPEVMGHIMDWMHKGGMMEQQMQAPQAQASIPGMPPPQSFPEGSTPYTRLQARINAIGRGNGSSRNNRNGGY